MIDVVFPDNESCPDCGSFLFRPGPRGGAAQNIECVGCSSRFNVTRYPDGALGGRGGKIVWAQRIPREDEGGGEWRADMFPKVLE